MNYLTLSHTALKLGTSEWVIQQLICKDMIKADWIGDLLRIRNVDGKDWEMYRVLAESQEAINL